jgi:hypothetical protein
MFGHFYDWKKFNPDVIADVRYWRLRLLQDGKEKAR